VVINAENNWWGDPSGPLDTSDDRATGGFYNPGGLGDRVSNYVDYEPWLGQPPSLGSTPLQVDLLDPRSKDLELQLSIPTGFPANEPFIQQKLEQLATADQSLIRIGVATDSVSLLLIRITANVGDIINITLEDGDYNGSLKSIYDIKEPGQNSISVETFNTSVGGRAFAIYQAPPIFDDQQFGDVKTRFVQLTVRNSSTGESPIIKPVFLERPPVLLVHGIWSSPTT